MKFRIVPAFLACPLHSKMSFVTMSTKSRNRQEQEKMNCKETQRLLVPYINGDLEEKEEGEFVRHVRRCPECYEELGVYATVFAGIRQLDGAEEEIDYRTLVEDTLENSEEDVTDEYFLATYTFFLKLAATVVLFYMIVRWFF